MRRSLALAGWFAVVLCDALGRPPHDFEARVSRWSRDKPGGIAVGWVDRDGVSFACAGHYSAGDQRAISESSQFYIGSLTKVFTALLLAQTERLGKANRGDSVVTYLAPDLKAASDRLGHLTLLALGTHRGGLPMSPDNWPAAAPPPDNPFSTYDREMLMAALLQHGPNAPAGRSMVYSNLGFSVLGEALGRAWGTGYPKALAEGVLKPLGLESTVLALRGIAAPACLAPQHGNDAPQGEWTFLAFAPAGALCSSASDLSTFISAYLGHTPSELFSSMQQSVRVQAPAEDYNCSIGLGWFLADDGGQRLAWHAGATSGSRAVMVLNLTQRTGIAVLANSDQSVSELAFELLGATKPVSFLDRPPLIDNPRRYVGVYQLSGGRTITVTEERGALFARQNDWERAMPLRQLAPNRFAVVMSPAEITFHIDGGEVASTLQTDLYGHVEVAKRR